MTLARRLPQVTRTLLAWPGRDKFRVSKVRTETRIEYPMGLWGPETVSTGQISPYRICFTRVHGIKYS